MTTEAMVTRETVCAGFVDRFIAVLIDTIILLIPNLVFIYVVEGLAGNALSIVLNAAYTLYFWTSSGSTPGKSVMGLKVVSADGGALIPPGTAVLPLRRELDIRDRAAPGLPLGDLGSEARSLARQDRRHQGDQVQVGA